MIVTTNMLNSCKEWPLVYFVFWEQKYTKQISAAADVVSSVLTYTSQYCNTVTSLDTDVLARICTALDCSISNLLEFVPLEKNE